MLQKKETLIKKIKSEMTKLSAIEQIVKGNVYEVTKKSRNSQYDAFQLTYKGENNITKTVYVKKEKINDVKKAIGNYKKMKQIIDKVILLNIELIKLGV